MKNLMKLFTIVLLLITVAGSSNQFSVMENNCRSDKLITAEPGTCFHPDALRVLKAIEKFRKDSLAVKKGMKFFEMMEPGVNKVIDTLVSSGNLNVPLRIYYPNKKSITTVCPIVFYIHGGAFMHGSIEDYDMLARKISKVTRSIVASVEYRLAPDHPYPAAIDDSYCALKWVSMNAESLGGRKDWVCLMGSSAGGNIATVLTLKSKDLGSPEIACQVLFYPPTTFLETEFPSRIYFLKDTIRSYFLTEELVRRSKKNYLAGYNNVYDPYLSPLESDLVADLPAALIFTAQCDPLRDEGHRYADKLRDAGTEVTYIEYEGQIHGFLSFYMVLRDGKRSLKESREFIHSHTVN